MRRLQDASQYITPVELERKLRELGMYTTEAEVSQSDLLPLSEMDEIVEMF